MSPSLRHIVAKTIGTTAAFFFVHFAYALLRARDETVGMLVLKIVLIFFLLAGFAFCLVQVARHLGRRRWANAISWLLSPIIYVALLWLGVGVYVFQSADRLRFALSKETYLSQVNAVQVTGEPRFTFSSWATGRTPWGAYLVFDESDESALAVRERSADWWKRSDLSGWSLRVRNCETRSIDLGSHFYVVEVNCTREASR